MSRIGKLAQPGVESKVEELAFKLNGDDVRLFGAAGLPADRDGAAGASVQTAA